MTTFWDCVHRVSLSKFLDERGGFTPRDRLAALYGRGCSGAERVEIERRIVTWLMRELQKLPRGKATSEEASPVRRRGLLSRLELADVAIALLDYPNYYDCANGWGMSWTETPPIALHPPSAELVELLGHLLNVPRHRATVASPERDKEEAKFLLAAHIDGVAARRGQTLSVRRLSALAGVSSTSVCTWRKDQRYQEHVDRTVKTRMPAPHPDMPDF